MSRTGVEPSVSVNCVYCLGNGHMQPEQVLTRGAHFYVCAPKGQLLEGFLAIAPYACAGALARMPAHVFSELAALQSSVRRFYAAAYGAAHAIFYEQGRGGDGARTDSAERFPLHAHLCSLPVAIDLHRCLSRRYVCVPVTGPARLKEAVHDQPYLYVDACGQAAAYVGRTEEHSREIARARLKPVVAALLGIEARADWRAYPGERELTGVIQNWRQHCLPQA